MITIRNAGKGHLPLTSLLLDCKVTGAIATASVTQTFTNEEANPLECAYTFPVLDKSVMSKLILMFEDGRVLEAKVEDIEEAKETYSDAISAGHTVVYGEMKTEKEFQVNIGSLGSMESIKVEIWLVFPLICTESRWVLQVPDWLYPTAHEQPSNKQFKASLTIIQYYEITEVTSSSHDITVAYDQSRLEARVLLQTEKPRDRSLNNAVISIEFRTVQDYSPKVQVEVNPITNEKVGMLSFIPHFQSADQSEDDLEGCGDFVLILDRSGSMSGQSIETAKEAAVLFLLSLPVTSKFNIVSFGSGFEKMFPESRLYESNLVTESITRIKSFTADLGGTNILNPLIAICSEQSDSAFPRSLYLLTDGEVEDRDAVITFVEEHSKQVRVHTFGIGTGVDRDLIIDAAKAGNGSHAFIANVKEIKSNVIRVLKHGLRPALSNLQLTWQSSSYEQSPSNQYLPVCYLGEMFTVFVNFGTGVVEPGIVKVTCTETKSGSPLHWEVPIDSRCATGNSLEKLWAKYAIKELDLTYRQRQDQTALLKLKKISKQYGVPSQYTAFICVSDTRSQGQQEMRLISISRKTAAYPHTQPSQYLGGYGASYCSPPDLLMCDADEEEEEDVYCLDYCPPPEMSLECCSSTSLPLSGNIPRYDEQEEALSPQEGLEFVSLPAELTRDKPNSVLTAEKASAPRFSILDLLSKRDGLFDLLSKQDASGLWHSSSLSDWTLRCPVSADFSSFGSAGLDLWTTLCVVVVVKSLFREQADEWELIIKKAMKVLKANGIDVDRYQESILAQLS